VSTESDLNLEDLFPLPPGVKDHTTKFGANPVSALVPVPAAGERSPTAPRPDFEIRWEDQKLGVKALMREGEDGRLIADVFCNDPNLLGKGAVSVTLAGAAPDPLLGKIIPLTMPDANGCKGSADFGPLASAVQELGPRLCVVVMLLV
jgi:hypothetical protein